MPKNLSPKFYQENKERLQKKKKKKARERYQTLSKEEKEKSNNMVVSVTKISQKIKSKSLLSIETLILKNNDLESSCDEE